MTRAVSIAITEFSGFLNAMIITALLGVVPLVLLKNPDRRVRVILLV